ncbi:MAG: sugar phosphate nucleotidyltransferase [Flavobacteriaceae bacterium]
MSNKCQNLVVLAAGMSSRMKKEDRGVQLSSEDIQQANQRTKSLISIGNKGQVLLDYILFNAQQAGFKNVYVVTGKDNALFKEHYKNKKLGLELFFAVQHIPENRMKPLGTADAVCQLLAQYPDLKQSHFVVCNSDNLYSVKAFKVLRDNNEDQALISYDRDALQFSAERISKFAVISVKNNYVKAIVEKPTLNQLEKFKDYEGKIRVSMNIFKLYGKCIFPFLKDCPLHPIRQEKELPVSINNYLKVHPLSMRALPLSEHVPDLTSKKDIAILRKQLKDIEIDL